MLQLFVALKCLIGNQLHQPLTAVKCRQSWRIPLGKRSEFEACTESNEVEHNKWFVRGRETQKKTDVQCLVSNEELAQGTNIKECGIL